MKRLSRRTLLRGSMAGGTVAIGLPLLEAMIPNSHQRQAQAQASEAPKRALFWFSANGTRQDVWTPPANMDLVGHPIHDALAPFQQKLLFLDGVDQEASYSSIGDGHQTGMGCLLTNAEILPGSLFCEEGCEAGSEVYVGWGGGISIDQFMANEIAKDITLKFKSLEFGVQVKSSTIWSRMSYSAADQPVPHREDPNQNFIDLFSDLNADPFELELIRKRRQSVLDAIIKDFETFNNRLGAADKLKLDQHLTAIRELEKRLDATGVFGEACGVPNVGMVSGFDQNDNYPACGKAQMDLLVMALACDMTRVASLQWSRAVSNVRFTWINQILGEGHHDLSHYDDADGSSQADILSINQWYTEQFAYLLAQMDSIQEGDGTMLDNCVVTWVNELGKGNSHTRRDIPFLLAGGCKGYFNTGRAIDFGGQPHGKLLVSLAHAMDMPITSFGMPQHSDGPLSGLSA
jgi:hypothetical protein